MIKVQFAIITCYLLGAVSSASLFGLELTAAPEKVAKNRVREIPQILKPSKPRVPIPPLGLTNQFVNENTNDNQNSNAFLESEGTVDSVKPQKLSKIIKFTTEDNQVSDASKLKGTEQESEVSDTIVWPESETGTDYTTETSDFETTTLEYLNRIGGAPPAVVASLLG